MANVSRASEPTSSYLPGLSPVRQSTVMVWDCPGRIAPSAGFTVYNPSTRRWVPPSTSVLQRGRGRSRSEEEWEGRRERGEGGGRETN